MFNILMNEINYVKQNQNPQRELYRVYGNCQMARRLDAITADEFMTLNHEVVCCGINNPEYFDKGGK